MDLDFVMLKDLEPLRKAGFRNVLAKDFETQCGISMSSPFMMPCD